MMIIQDEYESMMIGDKNLTEIMSKNNELLKSANRRKQVKPIRVTNDDGGIPNINESSDLTNGNQSSPEDSGSNKQEEAYCNLCDRSFCNKYFLKAHIAKKHEELNMVSPLSLTENNDNANASLSPPSNEQPLPLIGNQQSSSINNNKTNEKNSEDYCEICQKHFCNKYYLRKHKGECHGVYTDYIKSLQKSTNESPVKTTSNRPSSIQIPSNTLLLNPFYPGPSDIKSLFPISSTPSINIKPKSSPQRSIRRCNICKQEFRNRSLFRMHMNTFHPNEKNKKNLPTASTNLGFLPPFVDTSSQLAQKLVDGQTSQAIVNDSYFSAKMADRVVCEICNKQVCNKYFLKTHKAKVHGITNDEAPEPINENLDNSNTYCSLCKKDFSTKYFYLFHMQTIHNDAPDSTYQSLLQFMKMNGNSNPLLSLANSEQLEDEADGNTEKLKRKRSLSQLSTDNNHHENKRLNSLTEANAGLQPFLLESEDPKFSHTFVPCMVYLPVIRRVTKQVKINLRLKPVLADASL